MKREITTHKVNGLNDSLQVVAIDDPGCGGACHDYQIRFEVNGGIDSEVFVTPLHFQMGPVASDGPNGISNESLLAIVADRLEGFQCGAFACEANAIALEHIKDAMEYLHARTKDRIRRGVEGTNEL